jgi:hypothetical protein
MSQSYRKPYAAFCGGSATKDKYFARRFLRHAENQAVRDLKKNPIEGWDDFHMPIKWEATHNNHYDWAWDGEQHLRKEPTLHDELHWYHCGYFTDDQAMEYMLDSFEKAKRWYEKLKRK